MTTVLILKIVFRDALTILLEPFPWTETFDVTCDSHPRRRYAVLTPVQRPKSEQNKQVSTANGETDQKTGFSVPLTRSPDRMAAGVRTRVFASF